MDSQGFCSTIPREPQIDSMLTSNVSVPTQWNSFVDQSSSSSSNFSCPNRQQYEDSSSGPAPSHQLPYPRARASQALGAPSGQNGTRVQNTCYTRQDSSSSWHDFGQRLFRFIQHIFEDLKDDLKDELSSLKRANKDLRNDILDSRSEIRELKGELRFLQQQFSQNVVTTKVFMGKVDGYMTETTSWHEDVLRMTGPIINNTAQEAPQPSNRDGAQGNYGRSMDNDFGLLNDTAIEQY